MRKLLYLLIAAALCVPVGAQAWWKSIQQVGVGSPPVLPVKTYIGGAGATSTVGSVSTISSIGIGTAAADRLVVVVVYDSGGNTSGASLTINGNAATFITRGSVNFTSASIFSLLVTAGTTAPMVCTFTGTPSDVFFEVYTLNQLSSMTASGSNSTSSASATALTTTLATSSGGIIITGSIQFATGSTTDVVSSGSGETFVADHPNFAFDGFSLATTASASGVATNASSSVTATWNGVAQSTSLAAASWR